MHRLVLKDASVVVRNDHEISTIIFIVDVKQQHHNNMTTMAKTIAAHNKSITKKQSTISLIINKRDNDNNRKQGTLASKYSTLVFFGGKTNWC
jgi:hypothetical protein